MIAPRKLLVAKTATGPVREATKKEVCQHWMVPKDVWMMGGRVYRCAFGCGHSEIRKRPPDIDGTARPR